MPEFWGGSRELNSLAPGITETEIRNTLREIFEHMRWQITQGGDITDPHGTVLYSDKESGYGEGYVNCIPTRIEVIIYKDNRSRQIAVRCYKDHDLVEEINK